MKNKLFILIVILLAFTAGICLNIFLSHNNQNTNVVQEPKKERQFKPLPDVPVSNSSGPSSKIVFKSFFAYDATLDLNEFVAQGEEIYFKKIISYDEYLKYKELIPELRTLTEDDFVNYFLIIALSNNVDSVYMFNRLVESDDSITLKIAKNKKLSELASPPVYSGVAIVLPNIAEVPNENIKFEIEQN